MSFLKWLFGKKKPSIEPVDGESFVEYIDRQGFKHFRGKELTGYFEKWRGDVQNSYPPRALWPNFVPTLRVVDDIRRVLGCPVRITSSYRSPAYNKAVAGAPLSFHQKFVAADIQCDGATPHEVWKIACSMRNKGMFKGGIGLYNTFVHIDTRGVNADW